LEYLTLPLLTDVFLVELLLHHLHFGLNEHPHQLGGIKFMPDPILRQKWTMSEIFGIRSPSQEEVEIPRTENLDNLLDPN